MNPSVESLCPGRMLVDAVADWLCGPSHLRVEDGAPSLAHLLVVVPTAEAGRRLRRALAVRFATGGEGGRAVVPPLVMTPPVVAQLFADAADAADGFRRATPAEASGVLARLLASEEAEAFPSLLPAGPAKSFVRALSSAKALLRTLDALGEDALSAADVALDELAGKDAELGGALGALDAEARDIRGRAPSGRDAGEISAAMESPFTDRLREKWGEMARLEAAFFAALRSAGLRQANESLRAAVGTARVPERLSGVEEVVLPALSDAIPVLYRLLGAWCGGAGGPALRVLLHAPGPAGSGDGAERLFDVWGRPVRGRGKGAWLDGSGGPLATLSGAGAKAPLVRQSPTQREQAADAVELLFHDRGRVPGAPPRTVALAMLDPELEPALAATFAATSAPRAKESEKGAPTTLRSPSLRPLSESPLGLLFTRILAVLAPDPDFDSWSAFLRLPDVQTYFRREFRRMGEAGGAADADAPDALWRGPRLSAALAALDELQRRHLPKSRAALVAFLDAERAEAAASPEGPLPDDGLESLAALVEIDKGLRSAVAGTGAASRALGILRAVFGARGTLDGKSPDDRDLEAAASALRELILAVRDARPAGPDGEPFSDAEQLALLGGLLSGAAYSLDAGEGAFPALGWLELPWCDEERMVISGFNEGSVPAPLDKDALLPDALRRALGLSCDERRLARDAFVLSEVLACRQSGDVAILCERTNAAGEARLPSRLLFACPDDELAARAAALFREPESREHGGKPSLPANWRLALPTGKDRVTSDVSVTAFQTYLESPFWYFLGTALGWDPDRDGLPLREIPANDFGTLCHGALEAFGKAEDVRDETDEEVLFRFLERAFETRFQRAYGPAPAGVLRLQRESCLERLRWFAGWQAARRKAGWHIRHAEVRLRLETGALGPLSVKGRADRVDQHDDGSWQILDYKTWAKWDAKKYGGASEKIPAGLGNDGLVDPRALAQTLEAEGVVPIGTPRKKWWSDLQLPLYVYMARANGFWAVRGGSLAKVGAIPEGAVVTSGYLVLGDTPEASGLVLLGSRPGASPDAFPPLDALGRDDPEAINAAAATARAVLNRIAHGVFLPVGRKREDFRGPYAWKALHILPGTADPVGDGIGDDWRKEQGAESAHKTPDGATR